MFSRFLFSGVLGAAALAGFGQSINGFFVERSLAALRNDTDEALNKQLLVSPDHTEELIAKLERRWERAARGGDPDAVYMYSRLASMRAVLSSQNLEAACTAYNLARESVVRSPFRERFHLALADLELRIPDAPERCAAASSPIPEARLAFALKHAPWNTAEMYQASLLLLSEGRKDEAFELLRRAQEVDPNFSVEQREWLYELVRSESDLEKVVPRRYPEVVRWVREFSAKRPKEFLRWETVFAEALREGVIELESRLIRKETSESFFAIALKNIAELSVMREAPALRQKLDEALAEVYERDGNKAWAKLLRRRAALERIPVLKSVILDDRQPQTSMLYGWRVDGDRTKIVLDALGRSVGLYFPGDSIPQLLLLQSSVVGGRLNQQAVKIYESNDNLSYHPITQGVRIETYFVDGKQALSIEFESPPAPYLKLFYTDASRAAGFQSEFINLIQVYGTRPQ